MIKFSGGLTPVFSLPFLLYSVFRLPLTIDVRYFLTALPLKKRAVFNPTRIDRKRRKLLRAKQSKKARSQKRKDDRIQHAATRSNKTGVETEQRLTVKRA